MAAMSVSEEDAKLASQCLDLCQTLAGKSLAFSFSLTIGSSFSFSVDTRGKEVSTPQKKKKTPSTLRRDARRREQFLRKKFDAPNAASSCHSEQVSKKEAEAPVLKTPEKERSPPPMPDRSLTPVLGEGREEPPSSALTPVAVEETMEEELAEPTVDVAYELSAASAPPKASSSGPSPRRRTPCHPRRSPR